MIRGTAAKFKLPYSYNELEHMAIRLWQLGSINNLLSMVKCKSQCYKLASHEMYVSLSATETTKCSDKYKAKMQLRAQPFYGDLFGRKNKFITIYLMQDDISIYDPIIDPILPTEEWVILDEKIISDL